MSKNRMINTKFWSDTYISSIDPLEKLLFLYFITNQYTNICGIYEIPLKQVALDTGIDRDNLEKVFLPRLANAGKIFYIDGWVYIKNFLKHQKASGNVQLGVDNGLNEVPSEIMAKIKLIGDTPPSHPQHSLKLKLESELKSELELEDNLCGAKAPTPSEIMFKFINETEYQEKIINALVEKGLNRELVAAEIKAFLNYWCELTKSGKQQRWQTEKTFELQRRLATWFNNTKKFNKVSQPDNKIKWVGV